jgi:uncharacterized membrane protein YsdA (DUF1294 family)
MGTILERVPDAVLLAVALAVGVGGTFLAIQYNQAPAAILGFVPFLAFLVILIVSPDG